MPQTTTGTDSTGTWKPRVMSKDFGDGDPIELDVSSCRECPFNRGQTCNEGGNERNFRMADIGEMKRNGFPVICQLPVKE
jgi:hypothetical protein